MGPWELAEDDLRCTGRDLWLRARPHRPGRCSPVRGYGLSLSRKRNEALGRRCASCARSVATSLAPTRGSLWHRWCCRVLFPAIAPHMVSKGDETTSRGLLQQAPRLLDPGKIGGLDTYLMPPSPR